jgi:hypothetical protein
MGKAAWMQQQLDELRTRDDDDLVSIAARYDELARTCERRGWQQMFDYAGLAHAALQVLDERSAQRVA